MEKMLVNMTEKDLRDMIANIIKDEIPVNKLALQKEEKDTFITRAEACELIGVSETTLTSYVNKGIITPIKVGRCHKYSLNEIKLYFN